MTVLPTAIPAGAGRQLVWRRGWETLSMYLPILLMALLALGTYWLVKNTPMLSGPDAARPVRHEPDYTMRGFAVRNFDANGQLRSEIFGREARHYPDTDTLEIDAVRIRSFNLQGRLTTATALRALSNGDGSEVQLFGNALVVREGLVASGLPEPRMEFRSEFLHAFLNEERVKSHKPVVVQRGPDQFTADAMEYNNVDRLADLQGRVRGLFQPRAAR